MPTAKHLTRKIPKWLTMPEGELPCILLRDKDKPDMEDGFIIIPLGDMEWREIIEGIL